MLQKIEEINLLKLMKDIKNMILEDKLELKNEDYEIKISKSDNIINLEPLMKLLNIMVKDILKIRLILKIVLILNMGID